MCNPNNSCNKIAPAKVEKLNLTITAWCVRIWSIPTKVMHIGKKTTLLHSPEFFSLYHRHMELLQKKNASS